MDHSVHVVCASPPRATASISKLLLLCILSVCCIARHEAHAAEAGFVGRSVGDVLDALRSQGLTFIYNTRIVPPQMRIAMEPQARSGVALAAEILAAHGLGLSPAAPGVYAVVAQPGSAPKPTPATAARAGDRTLEEVVVHTSRYTLLTDLGASESFLTQQDINNMPRLGDETLRAVQRLPGLAVNGFSALAAVRGGAPNETAIVLDGLRLYEPFHLKNFLSPVSLLDARWIDSLDVYSGGFPVLYGERMSGVVNATSIHPAQPRYYEAGLSLFHTSALASASFAADRGRATAAGRRSNLSEIVQFAENDFGEPQYADGFARVDWRFDDATRGSLQTLVSGDRIEAIRRSGRERANAQYRNAYVWGSLERDWSDRFSSRAILSYTEVDNERGGRVDDPGRRSALVNDERTFHMIGLRVENEYEQAAIRHRFGVEAHRLSGRYEYSSDVRFEPGFPFPDSPAVHTQRTARPTPAGYESAAYWDGRASLGERWTVQAGVRIDTQTYDGGRDSEQWSPRVNVLHDLSDATRLRATWGRFFQAQSVNELQVEDGVERFNPAQRADQTILGLDHAFAAGFDLRLEAYRKDYQRLHPRFENLFNPLVMLPEAAFDRVMIDADSARAEGAELLLRMRPRGPWRGWLGYSWSRAVDRIGASAVPRSWDQRHAVTFGLTWAHGPWTATAAGVYHTGWPITELTLTSAGGDQQVQIGRRNAKRLDDYSSLDLRMTRTFALRRGALDVFLELSNALSRKNPCCFDYTITLEPDGAYALDADVDSWLPLAPSVGVLWRY